MHSQKFELYEIHPNGKIRGVHKSLDEVAKICNHRCCGAGTYPFRLMFTEISHNCNSVLYNHQATVIYQNITGCTCNVNGFAWIHFATPVAIDDVVPIESDMYPNFYAIMMIVLLFCMSFSILLNLPPQNLSVTQHQIKTDAMLLRLNSQRVFQNEIVDKILNQTSYLDLYKKQTLMASIDMLEHQELILRVVDFIISTDDYPDHHAQLFQLRKLPLGWARKNTIDIKIQKMLLDAIRHGRNHTAQAIYQEYPGNREELHNQILKTAIAQFGVWSERQVITSYAELFCQGYECRNIRQYLMAN